MEMKIFWLKYRCMEMDAILPFQKIVFSLKMYLFSCRVSHHFLLFLQLSLSQSGLLPSFFSLFTLLFQNLSSWLALIINENKRLERKTKSVCVSNGLINNYIPPLVQLLE